MNKAISELSQVQRPAETNTVAQQRLVLEVLETPAGLHGAANQSKLNEESQYPTFRHNANVSMFNVRSWSRKSGILLLYFREC